MNYYKILEVDKQASPEVIQKAYKALSMKYHPDKQGGHDNEVAQERMRLLNEAYAVLSDTSQRGAYDEQTMYWRTWLNDGLIGLAKTWIRNLA